MEYRYLGRTGMKVSRVGMGSMKIGSFISEKDSYKLLDTAIDLGINLLDTANCYGTPIHKPDVGYRGLTEEIFGKWFAQGGGRREKTILSTKISNEMKDPLEGANDYPGLSAPKIRKHIDDCLRRMQTDHIEIMHMHDYPGHTANPWDEVWEAFEVARYQGKIDYVSSSNFTTYQLCEAQFAAKQRGIFGLANEQHHYNLFNRTPELELFPAVNALGLGVLTWCPMEDGLLTEVGDELLPKMPFHPTKRMPQIKAFKALCAEMGEKASDVGIAWIINNPGVSAPLLGPETPEMLKSSMRALEIKLDANVLKCLDEIFPPLDGKANGAFF
jgi:aryl-alcohol dehydrogenase-like predicted oxidoreductase